jgi:large conductance mechanosensitive channel
MFKEFKAFVNQGNAMDLAVGVVIGAAFGKIVNSLVNDIIMPIVGLLTGGIDFSQRYILLHAPATTTAPGASVEDLRKAGAVVLAYGAFINTIVEFVIIAFAIFLLVRQINKWRGPVPAKA